MSIRHAAISTILLIVFSTICCAEDQYTSMSQQDFSSLVIKTLKSPEYSNQESSSIITELERRIVGTDNSVTGIAYMNKNPELLKLWLAHYEIKIEDKAQLAGFDGTEIETKGPRRTWFEKNAVKKATILEDGGLKFPDNSYLSGYYDEESKEVKPGKVSLADGLPVIEGGDLNVPQDIKNLEKIKISGSTVVFAGGYKFNVVPTEGGKASLSIEDGEIRIKGLEGSPAFVGVSRYGNPSTLFTEDITIEKDGMIKTSSKVAFFLTPKETPEGVVNLPIKIRCDEVSGLNLELSRAEKSEIPDITSTNNGLFNTHLGTSLVTLTPHGGLLINEPIEQIKIKANPDALTSLNVRLQPTIKAEVTYQSIPDVIPLNEDPASIFLRLKAIAGRDPSQSYAAQDNPQLVFDEKGITGPYDRSVKFPPVVKFEYQDFRDPSRILKQVLSNNVLVDNSLNSLVITQTRIIATPDDLSREENFFKVLPSDGRKINALLVSGYGTGDQRPILDNDVTLASQMLSNLRVPESNIKVMNNPYASDFISEYKKLVENDYPVFFYAGHGSPEGIGIRGFMPWEGGVSYEELKKITPPGKVFACISACYAGAAVKVPWSFIGSTGYTVSWGAYPTFTDTFTSSILAFKRDHPTSDLSTIFQNAFIMTKTPMEKKSNFPVASPSP